MAKAIRVRVAADGTETRSESKIDLPQYFVVDRNGMTAEAYPNTNIPIFFPEPLAPLLVVKGGRKAPKIRKSKVLYKPYYVGSMYLRPFINQEQAKERIDLCVKALKTRLAANPDDFDAIAFTGMSGALIAPPVARKLGKSIIMVRKPDDKSTHSHYRVDGDYNARRYIILDDMRSTGATELRIRKEILREIGEAAKYVGMLQGKEIYSGDVDRAIRLGKPFQLTAPLERTDLPVVEETVYD